MNHTPVYLLFTLHFPPEVSSQLCRSSGTLCLNTQSCSAGLGVAVQPDQTLTGTRRVIWRVKVLAETSHSIMSDAV